MFSNFSKFLIPLLVLGLVVSCTKDETVSSLDNQLERTLLRLSPDGDLSYYMLPDGSNLSGVPAGIGNPLTSEKVELGKLLFHETALGRDAVTEGSLRTFSCATCHVAEAAFTA
ncbi:MAG: cytochrome c peroxidase, partial [Bacteroidota bacterium]